uniref:Uncharacterized protein n=1 Tax=Arundo donax TaxID=35708 RepID=A0A0A8ZV36_ARUDO
MARACCSGGQGVGSLVRAARARRPRWRAVQEGVARHSRERLRAWRPPA